MEIFDDFEQGSDAWIRARLGIPTASVFSTLMASGRGGTESKTRQNNLLYRLAGERKTGEPAESFTTPAMERGKAMEAEARRHYEFVRNCEVKQVGFIRNGKCGASPDGLISTDGVLEIKTAAPPTLIPLYFKGTFPAEHLHQCQGALMVSERKWCDLIVYWPKMNPLIVRTERDENFIQQLRDAIDVFDLELKRLVEKLK